MLAACSLIVDRIGWPSEPCFAELAAMWQGFRITEKLRKIMESGAELMPEVTLSHIVPVLFLYHVMLPDTNLGETFSRLLRQAGMTRQRM